MLGPACANRVLFPTTIRPYRYRLRALNAGAANNPSPVRWPSHGLVWAPIWRRGFDSDGLGFCLGLASDWIIPG